MPIHHEVAKACWSILAFAEACDAEHGSLPRRFPAMRATRADGALGRARLLGFKRRRGLFRSVVAGRVWKRFCAWCIEIIPVEPIPRHRRFFTGKQKEVVRRGAFPANPVKPRLDQAANSPTK